MRWIFLADRASPLSLSTSLMGCFAPSPHPALWCYCLALIAILAIAAFPCFAANAANVKYVAKDTVWTLCTWYSTLQKIHQNMFARHAKNLILNHHVEYLEIFRIFPLLRYLKIFACPRLLVIFGLPARVRPIAKIGSAAKFAPVARLKPFVLLATLTADRPD